jgi:hypothetical protein
MNNQTCDNTIPSWLLPCNCYLPRCKCPTRLRLDILCILGAPTTTNPLLKPNPNLKLQIFEFTHYNDMFPFEATTQKLESILLQPLLTQQGWKTLPPNIISACIHGSHTYHNNLYAFKTSTSPPPKSTNSW